MTTDRFDRMARLFALRLDRRSAVAAAGLLAAAAPERALAGSCRAIKEKCRRSSQCCSGLCKGKKNMTCRAHDTGGCKPGEGGCADIVSCTTSEGKDGHCYTTTGDAGFCGFTGNCEPCERDSDCQATYGPRSACIADCEYCPTTNGSACVSAGEMPHPMG